MKNKKALIRYAGAKWRLADWIISYFPEHKSYLEPFFGSGAILFSKKRSNIETINDLDGEVVNFLFLHPKGSGKAGTYSVLYPIFKAGV